MVNNYDDVNVTHLFIYLYFLKANLRKHLTSVIARPQILAMARIFLCYQTNHQHPHTTAVCMALLAQRTLHLVSQ